MGNKYFRVWLIICLLISALVFMGQSCQQCTDNDRDGFSIEGGNCGEIDCDDTDASINTAASEVCDDGADNNCDGEVNEGCPVSEAPITVTLLGTSAPTLNPDRFLMSTLITAGKKQFIVDAGRGAVIRLAQLNPGQETKSFARLDRVLLTHLHFDHIVSLDDLWLSRWMNARRQEPLQVWGPTGTKSFIDHMTSSYEVDISNRLDAAEAVGIEGNVSGVTIITTEITEDGVIYEEDGITITAFAVDHGMPALGYRIDYEDKSVVISGDTTYSPNLIQYAHGADLLLHEVFDFSSEYEDFPVLPEILRWHTTPEQAAAVFNLTKPKLAVYIHIGTLGDVPISDFVDRTKEHYDGPVIVGEDLMTITIADKVEVIYKE